jgi:transposase
MSNTSSNQPRTEVITSIQRRRRWAPAEKKAVVMETYGPGMTVSYVARKHGIAPSQLFYWRRRMDEGAIMAVGSEESVVPESQVKELEKRIKRLEQLLGKKTEEVEILKEAVKLAREKKLISRMPLEGVEDFE